MHASNSMAGTRQFFFRLSLISALAVSFGHAVQIDAKDVVVPVWRSGDDGYHTYRIPSVLRTSAGTLLAFSEARKDGRSDTGNIDLVMKRSTDGGLSWSNQSVIWDDGPNTCGNPCPVQDVATGRIFMLMTHNLGRDNEAAIKRKTSVATRTVWVMSSSDDGLSWTEPQNITEQTKNPAWGWYATGPGIGIQIERGPHAGRLVIPCDHSYDDPANNTAKSPFTYGAHAIYSDDHGQSWHLGGTIRPHANECQVFEAADEAGRLVMNCRAYFGRNRRTQALSDDGGMTWTEPRDVPDLVEPVCQGSVIRHSWPSEHRPGIVLFSNPALPNRRAALTVKASMDDGTSWPKSHVLHEGPAAYSCLVSFGDDEAGCLYEAGKSGAYETIVFHRFDLHWATASESTSE